MLFWGKKKKMLPDIIVGFVLLEGFDYNFNKLKLNLKNEWGIEIKDSAEEDTIAFNVDDMLIACSFVPEPIPDHEVESHYKDNWMWEDAEKKVSKHRSHVIISILNGKDNIERHKIFTKIASSILVEDEAIAVYMSPMIIEKETYRCLAKELKLGKLLVLLWVYIGIARDKNGISAYTLGLNHFKKKEVEILNSLRECEEIFEFLLRIVGEIIKNDINVEKGSFYKIGKNGFSFKVSSGIFVSGKSLKITY